MSRLRIPAACIVVIAILGLTAPALTGATGARLSTLHHPNRAAFSSGGLGLSLDDWEAIYGAGEPGQSYLSYDLGDGAYNVGIDSGSGNVVFIERTWDGPAGALLDDARSEALGLIPSDSVLTEYYDGASAAILYGTDVFRYRSSSLAKKVRGTSRNLTGYFTIIYEKIPSQTEYRYNATRFVLVVGVKGSTLG